MQAEQVLQEHWSYSQFREPQWAIIQSILQGKDSLALLPTGGGKSICFQVPALMLEGVCLVISPLIALMEDQVAQLKARHIKAAAIHSGMPKAEVDVLLDNAVFGQLKLLYLSPERLQTELFKERLKRMKVSFVAVDEAHCISQWGYDFRPPYLQISGIREVHPKVPFIALTATATKEVQADIADKLGLRTPVFFKRSFARPNISFVVRQTESKEKKLLEVLQHIPGTIIIYVRSRKGTHQLANWLNMQGISAAFYHAGLNYEERKTTQQAWVEDKVRVMVATNAFGMGINKDDVRCVVHMDLPDNAEAFYQEAGRGGRDGKKAYSIVIYHNSDLENLRNKLQVAHPSVEFLKQVYQALANYLQLAEGAGLNETFEIEPEAFGKRFNFKLPMLYPAFKALEDAGLVQFSEGYHSPSKLFIAVDKTRLYQFQVANVRFDPIIQVVLRLYGAELLGSFIVISEYQIALGLKMPKVDVVTLLQQLHQLKVMVYQPASDTPRITFLAPRFDAARLPLDRAWLDKRKQLAFSKMETMAYYVHQKHLCRQVSLLNYFDEYDSAPCGHCDVCLAKKKRANAKLWEQLEQQVLARLAQGPLPAENLEAEIRPPDASVLTEVVRNLLDSKRLHLDSFWNLHVLKPL